MTLTRADGGDLSWDDLYDFLDPERPEKRGSDRDREAERKYDEITRKLVFYFAGRGCRDAEDLAVETLCRVASKCATVVVSAPGDATGYFFGVARNVLHEWRREAAKRQPVDVDLTRLPAADPQPEQDREALHRRLEHCLTKLPARARRLIVRYYGGERTARVEHHRQLAVEFAKSVNALRIEVHRIRRRLRECVLQDLRPGAPRRGRLRA